MIDGLADRLNIGTVTDDEGCWPALNSAEPHGVFGTPDLMRAARVTVQPNTIVVHIKAIREEIMRTSPDFARIKAERARGYRWVDRA